MRIEVRRGVAGNDICFSAGYLLLHAALIVVLETDNIILPKIFAALYLDNSEGDDAGVFQPVWHADRDKGRLVDIHYKLPVAAGHPGRAGNNDPVLASVMVHLKGEALAWVYFDPLDLIVFVFFEDRIGAP